MKKKITVVLKFSMAFIISLIVLELFLRLTHISLPSTITTDPRLGRRLRPNTRITKLTEGFYMGKINKYGYNATAYPPERDRDALRIALVGDSFVEGHSLLERHHFGKILEKRLSTLIRREVEVLNFGISGICFRQMYVNYREWITGFKPDLTLFFLSHIDLLEKEKHDGPRCYVENGSLEINFGFTRSTMYKIKTRLAFIRGSSFYPLFQKAYFLVKQGHAVGILLDTFNPFTGDKREKRAAARLTSMETDDLFEINEAIFKTLQAVNDTGNTRNAIVLEKELPLYYKNAIHRIGLPLIDLGIELKKMEARGIDPYYWKATGKKGHWNHEAQQMIGNFLARYLAENVRDL